MAARLVRDSPGLHYCICYKSAQEHVECSPEVRRLNMHIESTATDALEHYARHLHSSGW